MARPIWSGAITFGIVTIPVQMFSAVHEHDVHFHQISKEGSRRIHYRKVVEGSEATVPESDIVKGYEVRRGRYVVFDDDELARIAARRSTAIDIESFVRLAEIDPRFFEQVYYLFPDEGGEKPYQLLRRAMSDADLVGVARLVIHGKEHLVIVRSLPEILGVQTLRFADEISDPRRTGPGLPHGGVGAQELELAGKLIASMTAPFKPAAYSDQYLARLKAAIARKARGQTVAVAEDEPRADLAEGKVINLMAALDRSLRRRQGSQRRPAASRRARATGARLRRGDAHGAARGQEPHRGHGGHGRQAS